MIELHLTAQRNIIKVNTRWTQCHSPNKKMPKKMERGEKKERPSHYKSIKWRVTNQLKTQQMMHENVRQLTHLLWLGCWRSFFWCANFCTNYVLSITLITHIFFANCKPFIKSLHTKHLFGRAHLISITTSIDRSFDWSVDCRLVGWLKFHFQFFFNRAISLQHRPFFNTILCVGHLNNNNNGNNHNKAKDWKSLLYEC